MRRFKFSSKVSKLYKDESFDKEICPQQTPKKKKGNTGILMKGKVGMKNNVFSSVG